MDITYQQGIISMPIAIATAVATAIAVATHYYYKNAFKYWQKQGLAGPKAWPISGNFLKIMADRDSGTRWMKEYGKVFGIYEGAKPVLAVADPEVLGQICIKDFNYFPNHAHVEISSELTRSFIFSTRDDHWRRVRAVLSPTFTTGKMRRMFKLIDLCAENMIEALEERLKTHSVVNLKDLFGLYTMDAIASCCYGLRLASYKGEASLTTAAHRDEFVRLGMKLFDFSLWRVFLIFTVNHTVLKWLNFSFIPAKTEWAFAKRVQQIIERRQKSGKNFDDYLQTLLDSKMDDDQTDEQDEDTEQHHAANPQDETRRIVSQEHKDKPLSEIEILSSATFLLLVGLETTSTLLTHCFYALSFHQDIQERLYQTVKSLARYDDQNGATFDYDSLTSCEYLDAVVSEALRLHPPAMQIDRQAARDYHLESHNLHIPEGTKVVLLLRSIMEDPDSWEQPLAFNPDRFMPENRHKIKPNSYCPFGIGPRHCLGMRFSLTETKLALAKLLLQFRFAPAPGTAYPGEPKSVVGFNNLKRPEVIITRR